MLKQTMILFIVMLLYTAAFAQPTLDTLSVAQGDSISRAFDTFDIKVFTIDAPATLDTTIISLLTSNELTDSTFKDYKDIQGSLVTITLSAGDITYLDPSIFFALRTYIKIKQHKVAAAKRLYEISLGRY